MLELEKNDALSILVYNRKGALINTIILPYNGMINFKENTGVYKIELFHYKERKSYIGGKLIKCLYIGKAKKLEEILEESEKDNFKFIISKNFTVSSKNTKNCKALYNIKDNGVLEISDYIEDKSLLFNNLKEINEFLNSLNVSLLQTKSLDDAKRFIRARAK